MTSPDGKRVPFLQPRPARLSQAVAELERLEASGIYSNFGPVSRALERDLLGTLFDGVGACLPVCNATLGLMLAIKHAVGDEPTDKRYALMPSFTFSATAQAALWCGLTPLFCDIEPDTWRPCPRAERELLERYRGEVAVLVPCTTFGNTIDLDHYDRVTQEYSTPVVVDAAAALGTRDTAGRQFGLGSRSSIIFSMHATKSFATAEAGLVYSADEGLIDTLRRMANFGFDETKSTVMPGLNAKLSEVGALLAQLKLRDFDSVIAHRGRIAAAYRQALPEMMFQHLVGERHAYAFMSTVLPRHLAPRRDEIRSAMLAAGVETRAYFSPHLAESTYFERRSVAGDLSVTNDLAARIVSLPVSDVMATDDVAYVAAVLRDAVSR